MIKLQLNIRARLLLMVLPIVFLSLFIVAGFASLRIFSYLENQTARFYTTLLRQVSNNIDFFYMQDARTLSNLGNTKEIVRGVNAPPYRDKTNELEISQSIIGGDAKGYSDQSFRKTIEEKIDGACAVYELDRKSIIDNTPFKVHRIFDLYFSTIPNYEKMINDPLIQKLQRNPEIKMIFGKFQDGVLSGSSGRDSTVIIYPLRFNLEDTALKKFILVIKVPDVIHKTYLSVDELRMGTLYILDNLNNIIDINHPTADDYYDYDEEKGEYILGDSDPDDPLEAMSFKEYQMINTDRSIIQKPEIQSLLNQMTDPDLSDHEKNRSRFITYKGVKYLISANFTPVSGTKTLFFYPVYQIHKPLYRIILIILILTGVIMAFAGVVTLIQSKQLAEPLKDLARGANEISNGNYSHQINTDRFFGEYKLLGRTFNHMTQTVYEYSHNLESLVKKRTEELSEANQKMKDDLKIAQKIQETLVPKIFPYSRRLEISAYYAPMEDLGGDLYDVYEISHNRIGVLIMDVCGHGVPAALITTLAKISFITNTRQHLKSGEIVTLVNRELNAIIREIGNYLTAFYAIIDTERQEIEYTNASHNDIYILSKDKTLKALKPNGTVVGIIGDLVYESQTESIQLEDKIVFYTDGIPEARNPQRKMYSDARLKEILIENREHSPQDLINKVLYDVNHFKEGCASDDDMTILIASFTEHKGDIAYDPDPIIDYAREEVNFSENEKFKTLNFDYKTAIELYKNRNFIESNIILMKILPEFKRKNDKFNILYLTGHNYYQLNELDHCRECWNRCHDINPNNKELIDNLEILERKMNPEK